MGNTAWFAVLAMHSQGISKNGTDARLWAISLIVSLVVNFAVLIALSHEHLRSLLFIHRTFEATPPPPVETVVTILAMPEAASKTPAADPQFARTSEDQRADRPEKPAFIGERDTAATSDRAPDATAPELPSQAGIEPKHEADLETTESDFSDGEQEQEAEPAVAAVPVEEAAQPPAPSKPAKPVDRLLEGPNPVDVAVPEPKPEEEAKPTPPETPPREIAEQPPEKKPTPPAAPQDPAFRGNQSKTAIRGSITRTGRSALDVADSPLGRYQALISRAVELEWQRNCVRHRDFITPGFLTVRFHLDPSGKVRSVQFVGEMETGEIQKGFTLNSIRNAKIPPMPDTLKADFGDQPLELIFNFYF
jgi:outer membrane biosynthesis protein TonB